MAKKPAKTSRLNIKSATGIPVALKLTGKTRTEKDSLGEVQVPVEALYGVQTFRGYNNFRVSGLTANEQLIRAYVMIKRSCVLAAKQLKDKGMPPKVADAIIAATDEVLAGRHHEHFIIDVFQAGAGTSFNMNTNEVLANLALERTGKPRGDYKTISPNDHSNFGQSTNDTMPTALRLSGLMQGERLLPVLDSLIKAFDRKAVQWKDIMKSGRTHLQDAVPVTLGQEFRAYASALKRSRRRLALALEELHELPIGGNAVGTGVNTPKGFQKQAIANIAKLTSLPVRPPADPREHIQSQQPVAAVSGALRDLCLELTRISNDLRLLCSGPTTGFDEIRLPAVQPGSSIMPGKVNPVMAECLNMVCFHVLGADTAISYAVQAGQLELNVMMPLMAFELLFSFEILINYLPQFEASCLEGIEAQKARCEGYLGMNPSLATMLNPFIGYLRAAEIAKQSVKENRSVFDLIREQKILTEAQIKTVFSPKNLTGHLD
ncbi:MAG: aspartate ammonia-lyase [Deltaproteobacteria bacterium]|nr:aspartate ammonia-lyase [Deltaproteobacteria bacterium]